MRWLYHLVREEDLSFAGGRYAPPSLAEEGFIHASYQGDVAESARLYFPEDARLRVLAIDPRRLDVPLEIATTPRGPMPHVHGSIPIDAVRVVAPSDVEHHPDRVTGSRIAFVAFEGMTLLDLVGPLDAVSRIAQMGFDETTACEVVTLTRGPHVWSACGATFSAARHRPPLADYDVLVVPGGAGARVLVSDPDVRAWLDTFPPNRITASVCTGALLLGAAGRLAGRRATTHARYLGELAAFGATAVTERVVVDGNVTTAGGVTAGIDLGLWLVRRLAGAEAAAAIAEQMEARPIA
jgi:putative intracellular protease/amidase/uncharacterized protein (DUF952 family)